MATLLPSPVNRWLVRLVKSFLLLIGLYFVAALFGSILPANQFWKSPDDGIELFIETNGLHTGIVMPLRSDVQDWSKLVRPEHLADPREYGSHILVGWGHAGVYRNTPRWQDLRAQDAASAIFGSNETLLHVYHLTYPQAYPHYRRSLRVSETEYRKIADAILARFSLDEQGEAVALTGYGRDDVFYAANGHYSLFYTCNSWTGQVLRDAGIRMGIWTPFQGGVMRWFRE